MIKALDDINVADLRRELKERQLNPKGKKEELRERLESWIMDNVDDYEFVDPYLKQISSDMKNLREDWRSSKNYYLRSTSEISLSAKVLKRSDTNCERLTENVEDNKYIGRVPR